MVREPARLRGAKEARSTVAQTITIAYGLRRNLVNRFAARERIEIFRERFSHSIASYRIFCQAAGDDFIETRGHRWIRMRSRERRGRKHATADGLKGFCVKGALSRNHFVEHHSK